MAGSKTLSATAFYLFIVLVISKHQQMIFVKLETLYQI